MTEREIPTELLQRFSAREAREYRLIPFEELGGALVCYGEEGRDYCGVLQEIEVLNAYRVEVKPVGEEELSALLDKYYREDGYSICTQGGGSLKVGNDRGFLLGLLGNALQNKASDIHLEPYEDRCRIRFRIDGKLIERYVVEKGEYATLVNQVKILAGLDISERRLPQDGRILYEGGGMKFDIRVSSLPTIHGEKMVLRLLTRQAGLLDLKNLGFAPEQLGAYRKAIRRPHGLVLISGPTGSGKSTTLYATLRLLNGVADNILTIEDPVEYTLEGVNQVQLKEEIGLSFPAALRTFLRQDPDIIMLGEIRDTDTAHMAIRSSLTGHLIFSTIHTNSAWGCVARLTDMGVHPYLLADTLILCMAQRLVRLLCPACKKAVETDGKIRYKAVGCTECHHTGYKGRKAIYEVIPVDDILGGFIRQGEGNIEKYMQEHRLKTLREAAAGLMETGETSPEEVMTIIH